MPFVAARSTSAVSISMPRPGPGQGWDVAVGAGEHRTVEQVVEQVRPGVVVDAEALFPDG
jgi:hypothetical protein